MDNQTLRVAAIHDISGFGRCSLSVILPVMSAMGVQACPIPTAVLSAHTGGLGDVVIRDLTDFLAPCLQHYKKLGIGFDSVYTGFLNSEEQIDHCIDFLKAFPNALKVVDPVMGDHGKPYQTCTAPLRARMKELAARADIITPNSTEAAMLLGEEFGDNTFTAQQLRSTLSRLSELGPRYVVITGAAMADGSMVNAGFDRQRSAYWKVVCDYVPVSYPGTGDLYAAVLVGGMVTGDSLPIAMERATRFLELAIKTTFSYGTDRRYGVMFEKALPYLTTKVSLKDYEIL